MKKLKFPAILGLAATLVVLVAGLAFWLDFNNRSAAVSQSEHSGHSMAAAPATPLKSEVQAKLPPVTNAGSAIVDVDIKSFAFNPKVLTITVGTTVRWTNRDGALHTATSTPAGAFDSGNLNPGQDYEFTFTQVGTFNYKCNFHGSMTATIVVVPAPVIEVVVKNFSFNSNSITIPVGTKVRWKFTQGTHNVVENSGVFNSGAPGAVNEYEFTFTQVGTYNYICTQHPSMQGKVVVVDYIPIDFLNPTQAEVNTATSLSVGGTSFTSGSVIYFNGTPLSTTTWITTTELRATIPADLVATPMVASITISNPTVAQFSNPLSLVVCNSLNVTNSNASGCGSLSQALVVAGQASQPVVITLEVPGGVLTVADKLTIPANTTLQGASCANSVVLNGNGVAGPGVKLTTNVKLVNLRIIGFNGIQLVVPDGGGNRLECVKADRIATS